VPEADGASGAPALRRRRCADPPEDADALKLANESDDGVVTVRAGATVAGLVWRSARGAPGWSGVLVLASLAGVATTLVIPTVLGHGVNAVVGGGGLTASVVPLGVLFAIGAVADMAAAVAEGASIATFTASLRHRGLSHALRLGLAGQSRFPAGDLTSRLVASTTDAASVFPAAVGLACGVATSCGGIVGLWLIDWRLCVTFVVAVVPTAAIVMPLLRVTTDLFTRYRVVQGAIASRLTDALGGTRTIRAAGTTKQEVERVLAPLPELAKAGHAMWATQRRAVWRVTLVASLATVAVLAVAGLGVAERRVTAGGFVAAAAYAGMGLGLLGQIDSVIEIGYAAAGAQRVSELLEEPAASDKTGGEPLREGPGAVAFRGVTAKGTGGEVLLDRLDLQIPPGIVLAVVGRSGAGKTTLAHLLGRLREPDQGEILLDGAPLASVATESLRPAVAYAFERPALLGATVHDTIAYARPDLPREQVELAAEMAQADTFILRLPAGYNTRLTDAPLSGGEAQRLGLARAFAQDARLVVLDDATSSLDTITEALVAEALTKQLDGHTRVVVAHRASTAARADLVAWIDDGDLCGLAPHEDLWTDPSYRAVFSEETG
jgi:ATP-binding cassette, subfamily B, bacterial